MIDAKLTEQTHIYLNQAKAYYGRSFRLDDIRADIRGKTAGYFRVQPNGFSIINFNPALFEKHAEDFLKQTVPHEVAHLVAYQHHGFRIRPHGQEWQSVMHLFGAEINRCHSYDVDHIKHRHYRYFEYRCNCKQHALTAIRHNRILKGQVYHCRKCHQPLLPVLS